MARPLAARCREIAAENGQPGQAAFLTEVRWDVEMLAGNHGQAEAIIAQGCAEYAAIGQLSTVLEPLLVRSQVALQHEVDLDRLARAGAGQSGWKLGLFEGAMAAALASTGLVEEAVQHARNAVDELATTDFITFHADATLILGDVLVTADRRSEAALAYDQALDLYRRKGDLVGAQKAARMAETTAVTA